MKNEGSVKKMREQEQDKHFSEIEAIFNCHKNNAEARAKVAFIHKFGEDVWDKKIQPIIDNGIMDIFNEKPNVHTLFFVNAVFLFVNNF